MPVHSADQLDLRGDVKIGPGPPAGADHCELLTAKFEAEIKKITRICAQHGSPSLLSRP